MTRGIIDNAIGGLSIGASYSQAEVQALRDQCEQLADEVRVPWSSNQGVSAGRFRQTQM